MARRKGFLQALAQAQREAERQRLAQARAQMQATVAAQRAQREYERARVQMQRDNERAQAAFQKEQARLYADARAAEVALQNEELQQKIAMLENILHDTLSVDDYIDFDSMKKRPEFPLFDPGKLATPHTPPPDIQAYLPAELSGFRRFLPGAKDNHARAVELAMEKYESHKKYHEGLEAQRLQALADARTQHEQEMKLIQAEAAVQHAEIDQFKTDFSGGAPEAIITYFAFVLEASVYPDDFPQHAKLAYVPESKQLVVEYDFPPFSVVPDTSGYRYVKTKDEVTTTARPLAQRKAIYGSAIAQITLRTLHELLEADRIGHIETIVFNGYVDSIDRGTGRAVRFCLVSVRTTREVFIQLDLSKVDPDACLKFLNASVSKSPTELVPVRPVLEFNMVDPRFIEETDVLSSLDQRPNLMELSPGEFEALISNLFQKMGLETRLTQASRDGGVDCVAYDPRPIFGGKVVIQAKRYKHTVGVSAVRDLYGTLQNEGASKGILVTTSGYGKAAFEFASGKPIELLSGSNLLYLLQEHAGIEAKIDVPDNWRDPSFDTDEG